MRDLVHCEAIHGDSGLDGPGGGPLLPRSPEPLAGSPAVPAMREAIATEMEQPVLAEVILHVLHRSPKIRQMSALLEKQR